MSEDAALRPDPAAAAPTAQPAGQEQYAVQPQQPQQYTGAAVPAGQPMIAPKNPAIGLLLSFFIPGLGSMVNGNMNMGVIILIVYVVGLVLSFILIGIPIAFGAWIWGMVDGYQSAQKWNRSHGIIS